LAGVGRRDDGEEFEEFDLFVNDIFDAFDFFEEVGEGMGHTDESLAVHGLRPTVYGRRPT
jgi:hypothetical protein